MLKKVLLLAAILVVAVASAASAQAYPPEENSFTADDTTVAPGEAIVLSIQVCQPDTAATFTLDSDARLATATADGDGVATAEATIPAGTAPGTHTIEGACTGADGQPLTQVLSITVTAPAGAGGTNLPTTGSDDALPMAQLGVAAVAAGGLFVLVARRRHTAKRAMAGTSAS